MREIISFILTVVSLYIFIMLASIEYGVSLFVAFPQILTHKRILKTYISPVWGTTNVFLVFFIVSLLVFFPGSIPAFSFLLPLALTVLIILGLRLILWFIFFYTTFHTHINTILLIITSFIGPMFLATILALVMTGERYFYSSTALVFALLAFTVIVSISLSFFHFIQDIPHKQLHILTEVAILCMIFMTTATVTSLFSNAFYVFLSPTKFLAIFCIFIVAIICLLTAIVLNKAWALFAAVCIWVAALLASYSILLAPYLVYPTATIFNSFTDYSVFPFLVGAYILGFLIIVPSLILLYTLFIFKKRN